MNRKWLGLAVVAVISVILFSFQNCANREFRALSSEERLSSLNRGCASGMAMDINGTCVSLENACYLNGSLVGNNNSITTYKTPSAATSCESELRSCKEGTLSGSYIFLQCTIDPNATPTPEPGQSCYFGGVMYSHGSDLIGYNVPQVNLGDSCQSHSQTLTCNDGTIEPSGLYAACAAANPKPNIVAIGGFYTTDPSTNENTYYSHACYIKNGALHCAGSNGSGQLGNGSQDNSNTLAAVPELASGVTSVVAGEKHTCAIKSGAVYCWGKNGSGQLGLGSENTNEYSHPQASLVLTSDVTQIAAGQNNNCAIKGVSLYCWGSNSSGELGDGSTANKATPQLVPGMDAGVTDVAVGLNHICAIKSGTLYCWGSNGNYQLGDGTTTSQKAPKALSLTNVTMVTASTRGTCAISGGNLYCWGDNSAFQAGQGGSSTDDIHTPSLVGNLVTVRRVMSSFNTNHVCAIDETSANVFNLKCWGANGQFQLGLGETGKMSTPTIVTVGASGNGVSDFSLGVSGTCAAKVNGDLYCWGTNTNGFMGIGPVSSYPKFTTPHLVWTASQ